MTFFRSAVLSLSLLLALPAAAAAADYRVVSRIEAPGGVAQAFAVDEAARRLYAGRDGGVDVYDIDSNAKVGSIAVSGAVGGVTLVPELGRGYASATQAGQVVAFTLADLKIAATVKAAGEPREIEYEARSKRIYVSGGKNGELLAFDAASGKPAGKLALGGTLRQASADGRGNLFVADQARHLLHVVDTTSLRSIGQISTWPGTGPSAIANDVKERRLYVACDNGQMIVVDPDPGQMISLVATTGKGMAGMAIQYAPARLVRLFMPSADGTLSVIQNAKLTATLEASVAAGVRSSAVAFDAKSGRSFLAGDAQILVVGK